MMSTSQTDTRPRHTGSFWPGLGFVAFVALVCCGLWIFAAAPFSAPHDTGKQCAITVQLPHAEETGTLERYDRGLYYSEYRGKIVSPDGRTADSVVIRTSDRDRFGDSYVVYGDQATTVLDGVGTLHAVVGYYPGDADSDGWNGPNGNCSA